ncbi:hypothetical protein FRC07_010801, partial [Ceratobasidium sp. 392]
SIPRETPPAEGRLDWIRRLALVRHRQERHALNVKRQRGISGAEDQILQATSVPALHTDELAHGMHVVHVAGENHHSIFVTGDGRVYGCGSLTVSQLGLGEDHPAVTGSNDEEGVKHIMSKP